MMRVEIVRLHTGIFTNTRVNDPGRDIIAAANVLLAYQREPPVYRRYQTVAFKKTIVVSDGDFRQIKFLAQRVKEAVPFNKVFDHQIMTARGKRGKDTIECHLLQLPSRDVNQAACRVDKVHILIAEIFRRVCDAEGEVGQAE